MENAIWQLTVWKLLMHSYFYLPHSSADFVIETLRNIGHVNYREPFAQLLFSEDIKAPLIKITRRDENEASVEVEPGYEVIQGRISGYALYEGILYRLPRDFPIPLYRSSDFTEALSWEDIREIIE